jgi:hypothetical protein
MVRGHVKPGVLSVNEEKILFRGSILPAHFAGPPEVGYTRFDAHETAVFGVTFEEGCLEGPGRVISGFQELDC